MKKYLAFMVLFVLLSVLIPLKVKANGGMFYPNDYPIFESGQKALIYFHDGVEDLVVEPSYQGSAKDFVWVIPTPSEPSVSKSDRSVFTALQKLTTRDSGIEPQTLKSGLGMAETTDSGVQIISEKTIDAFELVTLKASSETALSAWIKENGYNFPENLNYLLSDYVNSGWYFVIAKIRQEAIKGAEDELSNGTITPIRFTFKTEKIIYPMKLTQLAMNQPEFIDEAQDVPATSMDKISKAIINNSSYRYSASNLVVYVLSNTRVENSDLSVLWAGWLKPDKIKNILAESTENNWIESDKKLFLTKMSKYMYANQIKDDIVFAVYGNNDVFPVPFYKESQYWSNLGQSFVVTALALLVSPFLLLFIIISLMARFNERWKLKAKWLKAALLISSVVVVMWFVVGGLGGTVNSLIEEGPVIGSVAAFIVLELVLLVLTIKDFLGHKANTVDINSTD